MSLAMTLVIKRVKGKPYVYEQFRRDGRVYTQYIGPLEEMVRIWQLYKILGKVEKLSKRDLRRLAKLVVEEYSRAIEKLCSVVNPKKQGRDAAVWGGGPAGI